MSEARRFTTPAPIAVHVRNASGSIEVRARQTTETVVEISPVGGGSSSELAARTEMRLSPDGTRLDIEVPERRFGGGGRVSVLVAVPERSTAHLRSASADVNCSGILGGLVATTASGDVRAAEIDGDAHVTTASGDLRLGLVTGTTSLRTASGDVEIDRVAGVCELTTASGDLRIGAAGSDVRAKSASGDLRLQEAAEGRLDLSSVSGDVCVDVRPGAVVWLDLSTLSGHTSSTLDAQAETPSTGATLEIRAKTVSGDITVGRATAPTRH